MTRLAILLCILAALFALAVSRDASAHGDAAWIMNTPAIAHCCGPDDCRALSRDDVVRRKDGYWIKSSRTLVPYSFERTYASIDDHYWICEVQDDEMGGSYLMCFFIPVSS